LVKQSLSREPTGKKDIISPKQTNNHSSDLDREELVHFISFQGAECHQIALQKAGVKSHAY